MNDPPLPPDILYKLTAVVLYESMVFGIVEIFYKANCGSGCGIVVAVVELVVVVVKTSCFSQCGSPTLLADCLC